jgi:uncharacterized protein (DUF2236 family)
MPLRLVPPLPAGTPGDPGLTGPGSVTWRVCRERVVPLGGLSALLLQLAHTLVAAGVAEHSSVRADPTRRLMLTLEMLLVTTFGDARQVGEMTGRIAHIHRAVTGSLPQDTGPWRRGARYSATSPELCLWAYAIIIETTLNSYSAFVRRIPLPPWGYLLAAGLLPAPLRAQYGLRWSAVQRALWWLFTHAVHVVMCWLAPARLRFWDHYHVAVIRCRPAEQE